jgi:FO synthase
LSEIILNSELLNKITEGREVAKQDAYQIYQDTENNSLELYKAAGFLRNKNKGKIVTYSRKIFFNLINLCRDTCSYCSYKAEPRQAKISMMTKRDVENLAIIGKNHKCTEALFVTGERPEQKYEEARTWLRENGFSSTAD